MSSVVPSRSERIVPHKSAGRVDPRKYSGDLSGESAAAHAIGASEKVRSVELIEPLIRLVAELEKVTDINQLDYYAARDSIPTTMQQRRDACLDPARNALCALTDQKLSTGDQWIAWWKENKNTFKIVKK